MTQKTTDLKGKEGIAFGFLQSTSTTQRINLAIRRMKAAPEESGVPAGLDVQVKKFLHRYENLFWKELLSKRLSNLTREGYTD